MSTTSRRLVEKTVRFESPERIPRQAWILPWAEENHPQDVARLHRDFPDDIVSAPAVYSKPLGTVGDRYAPGTYVDEWGCIFSNTRQGTIGIVHEPLIIDWEDLERFRPPEAMLSLDRDGINAFCRSTDRFVLAGTLQRPFERLQFIRTMEQALVDLMEQPPELFELLDRIHKLYCREVELWATTDIDAIALMDDWGTQTGLLASPEIFRRVFKPMYRDYAEIAQRRNKHVFMHSDGHILEIIPDLIEVGIEALNSQVFCMGVRKLGERFRGRITFWGEIDRQNLLPHGTSQEIERAVHELWEALYADGGVIAQCEFGLEAKPENVAAVFAAWDAISRQKLGWV